jgi:hypothetical protein
VARKLLLGAALLLLPLPCRAEQIITPTEMLIRLNVHPMAAPEPALRYLLLPELREMNPGNPIQNYLRCFMEQQHFFFDRDSFTRREKYQVVPLKELPARELLNYGGAALRQADWAARLDKPDWELLLKLKTDGIGLLLPDLQQMRGLASALKVRFRAEVALCRFDDALRTAKTMFALARHCGENPTLIGELVGIAIAAVAIGPLEEMLEQPGCPNLYWALTNLPNPMIDLALGMEGERAMILGEFRDLDEVHPMTEEQINKVVVYFDKLLALANGAGQKQPLSQIRQWLDARHKDADKVNSARRRLIDHGHPAERINRFPVDQVFLLEQKLDYEVRRDEVMKFMKLPAWQIGPLTEKIKPTEKKTVWEKGIFEEFVPAIIKVRWAQTRLEQRFALLRHVEALRLYAAEHEGRLPQTLAEISVPLPDDPVTGKPFQYKLDGPTAHLRGTPPKGQEKNPGFNVHYEITVAAKDPKGQ